MAKIWLVEEKTLPARGYKEADRALSWCIEHLQLRPDNRSPARMWALVIGGARLSFSDDTRFVVVEVSDEEAGAWLPGYYVLDITPRDTRQALERVREE